MKSLFLSLPLFFLLVSCTDREEVPPAVLDAFSANHPTATSVEWEAEDDGTYEVEFDFQDAEFEEQYSADGQLLESGSTLDENQLPVAVMQSIASQYPNYEIDGISQMTNADGSVTYEVELEGDDIELEVIFAADGAVLNTEED